MKALDSSLSLSQGEVRDMLTTDGSDPSIFDASSITPSYGMELSFQSAINSPRLLFNQRQGACIVRLEIETDEGSDHHFVTYLAEDGVIVNNYPRSKVPRVEESDRARKAAPRLFYALFPGASRITLGAIVRVHSYSGQRHPTSAKLAKSVIEHPTTRATPPTLDDLFLELYMDELISYHELLRSTVHILHPIIDTNLNLT